MITVVLNGDGRQLKHVAMKRLVLALVQLGLLALLLLQTAVGVVVRGRAQSRQILLVGLRDDRLWELARLEAD